MVCLMSDRQLTRYGAFFPGLVAHSPPLPNPTDTPAHPRALPAPTRVVKLVRALRKGWIKREQEPEKPDAYLLWEDDGVLLVPGFAAPF